MTGYWMEPMKQTICVYGNFAILFFAEVVILGHFMFISLFLSIILHTVDRVDAQTALREEFDELDSDNTDFSLEVITESSSSSHSSQEEDESEE